MSQDGGVDVFGGDSLAGQVYRTLVRQPRSRAGDIAAALASPVEDVVAMLRRLAEDRLAVRLGSGDLDEWEAQPPYDVADSLISAHEHRLAAIRAHSRTLAELYWSARTETQRYQGIEVIRDRAVVVERYLHMHGTAQKCIRGFDRPPYYGDPDSEFVARQLAVQAERLAAGVEYRTVYEDNVLHDPHFGRFALQQIEMGEQARLLPSLPMKLVVSDESCAVLPLDPTDLVTGATLIVHPSALLTALIAVFEILWRLAVPVSHSGADSRLNDRERTILTLMSSGATDEAIARRLGMSRRTVVRHTAALLDRLGATTRFQAGVQAARLGWL
jgi:DNA-binding CsgD family transcriptional regulator